MKTRLKKVYPSIVMVLGILIVFQLLNQWGLIQNFVIPAPSRVLSTLVKEQETLAPHIYTSAIISIIGLLIAIPFGAIVALLLDAIPFLNKAIYPLLIASQTIPTIVITPIIVIMFGFGTWPRLIVVVLVCFFPITISFMQGLKNVDEDYIKLLKTMKASDLQILKHVKIPGATPSFFAGLKIAATYCVTSAILSELAGSGFGLGIYLMRTKRSYAYDKMFASILWIIALSLAIYLLVLLIEHLVLPRSFRLDAKEIS